VFKVLREYFLELRGECERIVHVAKTYAVRNDSGVKCGNKIIHCICLRRNYEYLFLFQLHMHWCNTSV